VRIPDCPRPLGALFGRLPQYPHSAARAAALNLFLRGLLDPADAARVNGKIVRIQARDAGIRATLRLSPGAYAPCRDDASPDATITATVRDFLLLALRKEDPDTLFFGRRLVIEGDTELGLIIKNALDRAEPPLPPGLLRRLKDRIE
jgi:O2-independent ubiquinone biosynthesis accessory factor UbiT